MYYGYCKLKIYQKQLILSLLYGVSVHSVIYAVTFLSTVFFYYWFLAGRMISLTTTNLL